MKNVSESKKKKRHARPKQAPPAGVEPLLVDRNEAAGMVGVSPLTLANWDQQGILKPVRLPASDRYRRKDSRLRRVLYSVADLRAFVATASARG